MILRILRSAAIVTAIATTGCNSPANATPIVDQDFLQTTYSAFGLAITSHGWIGENFTVGLSGKLAQVDLPLWQVIGSQLDSFTVNIATVTGGFPGSVLDSITISTADVPSFASGTLGFPTAVNPVHAIFSDGGVDVVAGQQLALVLTRTTGGIDASFWVLWDVNMALSDPNYYNSPFQGSFWFQRDDTVGFRAYVDPSAIPVPEPMALSLFATGLAGVLAMGRRKSAKAPSRGIFAIQSRRLRAPFLFVCSAAIVGPCATSTA